METPLTTPPSSSHNSIFPVELWQIIFGFACEDEPLLEETVPVSDQDYFVNCEWSSFAGMWWLREPKDVVRRRQMEGYRVKKAIMQTCRLWAQIGTEFMFRSIYISGPKPLFRLCSLFDRKSHLGSWTRAVHVRTLKCTDTITNLHMEDGLSSLIRQCPNLRYFNVACSLASSYRAVIGTLRFYCTKSLTSVHFTVPCDSQARVIAALASMRHLTSLKVELSGPLYDSGRTRSGYGCLVNVDLPHLREFTLRGTIQDFSEELPSWELPALRTLVLDFGNADCDIPDIIDVLSVHGPQLTTLDVNCKIPFDVADILELCGNLHTFCFNLDWRLDGILTKAAHPHIERIGMHGLQFAFGVGVASQLGQVGLRFIEATVLRNRNDINFASLNRYYFPNLRVLRILDPEILRGLNATNGPARGGPAHCYERWERWWDMCTRMRVRLEDCAGELLGTLPMEECGEEEEEEWEEGGEEEWEGEEGYEDYAEEDDMVGDGVGYDAGHPVSSVPNGPTTLQMSKNVGTSGISAHERIRTCGTPPTTVS